MAKAAFIDINLEKWSVLTEEKVRKRTAKEREWLKVEIAAINQLIAAAAEYKVRLFRNFECEWEGVCINTGLSGRKVGKLWSQVKIERLDPPFKYSRVLVGLGLNDNQLDRLRDDVFSYTGDARFVQIKRLLGTGNEADAFHILTAERAGLDLFITMDAKLVRIARRAKTKVNIKVCLPSEAMREIDNEVPLDGV